MRDLDWFDGHEEEGRDARRTPQRRRLLPALAAIPWLVVAALLVLPLRPDPTPSDAGGHDPTTSGDDTTQEADPADAHGDTEATAPDAAPTAPDAGPTVPAGADEGDDARHPPAPTTDAIGALPGTLEIEELRGRWRVAPGAEELAALAVVAARAHLTGIGPELLLEGAEPPGDTYAEHLVAEAVEHPSTETAVVTVLAVLLVDPPDAQARVELRRLAVPFAYDEDGPVTAGPPWDLPAPSLPVLDGIAQEPVDDPDLLVAADSALAVAGLGTQRTTALTTAPGWPVVATTTDAAGQERQVWLRRHLDGFVVAGSTLAGAVPSDGADDGDLAREAGDDAVGAEPSGDDPTVTDGSREEEEGS